MEIEIGEIRAPEINCEKPDVHNRREQEVSAVGSYHPGQPSATGFNTDAIGPKMRQKELEVDFLPHIFCLYFNGYANQASGPLLLPASSV